jgi:hypothetical protein
LAEQAAQRPVFMPASPTVLLATLGPGPASVHLIVGHCVSWLSPSVVVNQDPIELYVWLPPPAAHAEDCVTSSPDVFLLADSDPARLAYRGRTGQLLRLTAPARTAVDLSEQVAAAPEGVRRRILEHGGTHLLPLMWITRYRLTARFDVDGRGGITARPGLMERTLDVQFDGADHGVPGLPNEVVPWPGEDQRADTPSYLVLPDSVPVVHSGLAHTRLAHNGLAHTGPAHTGFAHNGFVALSRQRPELEDRSRILEIRVRRRRAIDVPATLDRLAELPMIGRLREFVGFDVLLSEQDYARAVVSKVWRYGPDGEPMVDKLVGDTLLDILAKSI